MTGPRMGSAALLVLAAGWAACRAPEPERTGSPDFMDETREAFDARMAWWREARFGMFIHWGPYAVPAGEYRGRTVPGIGEWIMERAQIPVSEYEAFAARFDPVLFTMHPDGWLIRLRLALSLSPMTILRPASHFSLRCPVLHSTALE